MDIIIENILDNKESCIYVIKNEENGLVKIGKASNINRRFCEIIKTFEFCGNKPNLTLEFIAPCKNNSFIESMLHKKYKDNRHQNEWFKVDIKEVLDFTSKYVNISTEDNCFSFEEELSLFDGNILNRLLDQYF